MTAVLVKWPMREGCWRKPAIVAASVGLHAVVLGYMAVDEFTERRRYWPDASVRAHHDIPFVYLDLRPRTVRTSVTASDAAPDTDTDTRTSEKARGAGVPGAPTAPAPRFTTEAQASELPSTSGGAVVWQARPETVGDRIERELRTSALGCANVQFLSLAERDICDGRMGERAAQAVPITRARGTGDESFERTARANDAWREYKTGEGAYPGLRSLFTDR